MNQLKQGIKVEMEHKSLNNFISSYKKKHDRLPNDRLIAEHIAKDHIKENKNYYSKLKKAKL